MLAVASDEYVSIPKAALILGIGEWRMRYALKKDPNFPHGMRGSNPVVRPEAVREYFRRRDEVHEIVSGPLGDNGDGDTREREA